MKSLINQYFEIRKKILAQFGYTGGDMMIVDSTDCNWIEVDDKVFWSDKPLTPVEIESGDNLYDAYIEQRWHSDEYIVICFDTETGGGDVLSIFAKSKEVTEPTSEQLCALKDW